MKVLLSMHNICWVTKYKFTRACVNISNSYQGNAHRQMSFAVNSNKTYKTKITYSVVLTEVCDKGDWNRLGLCVPIPDSLHTISFIVPKVQQRVTKGIRLACITKVRQHSKIKTTNHHCILEQCKQIIFSIKHCFKLCLKADCEHSASIFHSITSIHIFTPVFRMLRLPKFVLYSGIRKKFAVSFHSHELFFFGEIRIK